MGKRRIAIEKIACPKARNVCFSKRRRGLFKKAGELSRLHNLDIAAVVFSPAGKPYVFGDTSLFLNRYTATVQSGIHPSPSSTVADSSTDTYDPPRLSTAQNLLNVDISNLSVQELKAYKDYLESLRSRIQLLVDQNQEHEYEGFGLTMDEIFAQFGEDGDDNGLTKDEDFEDMSSSQVCLPNFKTITKKERKSSFNSKDSNQLQISPPNSLLTKKSCNNLLWKMKERKKDDDETS
ncbi:hypothetical protein U1Q18_035908 [Sarracenia purpurea var. burkii]